MTEGLGSMVGVGDLQSSSSSVMRDAHIDSCMSKLISVCMTVMLCLFVVVVIDLFDFLDSHVNDRYTHTHLFDLMTVNF